MNGVTWQHFSNMEIAVAELEAADAVIYNTHFCILYTASLMLLGNFAVLVTA